MSNADLKTCRISRAREVFDVSRETLYRWCKNGNITIHRHGNISLVFVKDVEDYIRGKAE